MRHRAHLLVSLFVAAWCCQAGAQSRIYTCVDAKGRRLTSDRPIMECLDREQQEYGTGGTVKGRLPPSMTGEERAVAEAKARKAEEERLRQAELRRRDRVLLNRYPTQVAHDRERAASLARLDDVIAAGEKRVAELTAQREDLDRQAKVTSKDVSRASRIRHALDENGENQAAQHRLLAAQRDERQRIATRFDEELARLRVLWAQSQPQAPSPLAATAAPPAAR
ncbi:MAG: DUF4124 domain-containing protein [Ramlibacter sp.]